MDYIKENEWAKSRTKLVIKKINDIFANNAVQNSLQKGNMDELHDILNNLVKEPIKLKYHIYSWLYENFFHIESGKDYSIINEAQYKEKINDLFLKNKVGKVVLNQIYEDLEKPAINVNRRNVYAYGLCLGMDEKVIGGIIKKGLLQREKNPRDYQEVIYRWCLANCKEKSYSIAKDIIKKYEKNQIETNLKIDYKLYDEELNVESCDYTIYLADKEKEIMSQSKEELFSYLMSLRVADIPVNESVRFEDAYHELVSHLCEVDLYSGNKREKEASWKELEEQIKRQRKELMEKWIENDGKRYYNDNGRLIPLVDADILKAILKEIRITEKVIRGRLGKRGKKERVLTSSYLKKEGLFFCAADIIEDSKNEETLQNEIKKWIKKDDIESIEIEFKDGNALEDMDEVHIIVDMGGDVKVIRTKKELIKYDDLPEVYGYVQVPSKVEISRKELILLNFILYSKGYNYQFRKLRRVSVNGFKTSVDSFLGQLGLIETYVNNPFDLLLIASFLTNSPWEYFLSCWAQIQD